MRLLVFLFLFNFSFAADTDSPPDDRVQNIQTFKGYIVSVQKFNLVTRPAPQVLFILNANGDEYTVAVGPEWYTHSQGILLIPREEIEVQGSVSIEGQKKIIVAHRLKQGKAELKLRDPSGNPLWGINF